jgi:hypothetical protein
MNKGGHPVFQVSGYFSQESGDQLVDRVRPFLLNGQTSVVVDFSECSNINSLGVSRLYVLALMIADDFVGNLYLTGLDSIKISVLTISGIFPLATPASSVDEACRMIDDSVEP